MHQSLAALCLFSVLTSSAFANSIIRNYQPLRHDRFYSGIDKAFVGDPYDFSGVGYNGSHWATLVSDSYFVTAAHHHGAVNDTITFWETNDASGPSHTYTIAGGSAVAGTDLWVGWFNTTVDPDITRYPVISLATAEDYLGLELYSYGVSHVVGRNVSDGTAEVNTGSISPTALGYDYDNADTPSVGGDENFLQPGDSGAPTFTVYNGALALLGVHWFVTDDVPNTNEGEFSVDTFLPSYINGTNQILSGGGETLQIVPEPTTAALLLFGTVPAVLRRWRAAAK